MSGKDMRMLMEKIDRAVLHEGYEQRVQNVVDYLNKTYPDGMTKKQFTQVMDTQGEDLASKLDAFELKRKKAAAVGSRGKTGDSRKEFIQDVAKQMDFRRDTGKADAKRERAKKVLQRLELAADEAIGNAMPDGDPVDRLIPQMLKMGIPADDMYKWLNKIARNNGSKDWHSYLADIWDDLISGNYGHGDEYKDMRNPWR
jgi:hypothetical protein